MSNLALVSVSGPDTHPPPTHAPIDPHIHAPTSPAHAPTHPPTHPPAYRTGLPLTAAANRDRCPVCLTNFGKHWKCFGRTRIVSIFLRGTH